MLKTDLKAEATKTRRLNLYPNTVDEDEFIGDD